MKNPETILIQEKFVDFKKLILKMKLALILLFIGILQLSATAYSQKTKMSFTMNDKSVKEVFNQIEKVTDFRFFYNENFIDLNKQVTIEARDSRVEEILDELLASTDVTYRVLENNLIVITPKTLTQQQKVIGTVIDKSGLALPGVNVVITGTTLGTITDLAGKYSIDIPSGAKSLRFSFVGMEEQEINIGTLTQINITMYESAIDLEEVVVIGYGTAKKSDLTGSIATMKANDFKTQPMIQVSDMLTGTVAGFYAKQSTSAAGGSSMEIRGPTSLSAGTNPLIVLDGTIYNGSLSDINPNDIQSVDILKDASSAAIFGSKAASGVVIITTTKGRIGKPTINFSSKIGISEAEHNWMPFDGEEFLQFRGDYFRTKTNFTDPRYYYTRSDRLPDNISVEEWRNYSLNPNPDNTLEYLNRHELTYTETQQYLAGESVNWYDMVMIQGLKQDYDLSIVGGTENINYYWSIGYINNEGIIKGDKFTAIRSRLNVDFKITDWLKFGANTQFADRDESATMASLERTYRVSPWGKPYNEDGTIVLYPQELFTAQHPLMEYYGTDRLRKINSLFSSIYGEIQLPFGIVYRLSFQPRYSFLKDYDFYGDQHSYGFADHIDGYGTRQEDTSFEWMVDNLLKWNREIGIHNFDITLLYNIEQAKSWLTDNNNQTFSPNRQLGYHALQFGNTPYIYNYDTKATGDALMGRLNYTLLGKYLLTASLRRDGYSAFGQENPRAIFPAVALAWQISEEDFYKIDLINRMKLRLSWGVNGNRDIGIYSALANLGSTFWYSGSKVIVGVYNSTLANYGLKWERTESFNFGLELGLFEDRINLTLDYYDMTTTNLLMKRRLPVLTGFQDIMSNLGELGNRGFEASLNTTNINKPGFNWKSNLVFSLNRNEIRKLFGDVGSYTILGEDRTGELPDFINEWFPGQAIDVIWDYKIIGIWQENESEDAAKYGLRMGDIKADDVDRDDQYVDVNDKKFLGYTRPRYRIGLRNDFSFLKNFTASLFIRADLGHLADFTSVVTQGSSEFNRYSMSGKTRPYWTPENPINNYPRLDADITRGAFGGEISVFKPSSFIRIQDFSISYNLPAALTQRLSLKNLSAFFSIRNLYSFDNWPGFDPESGLDPMPRTYTVGLNLSL